MRTLGMLCNNTVHIDLNNIQPSLNDCELKGNDFITPLIATSSLGLSDVPSCVGTVLKNFPEVFDNKLGTFNKYKVTLNISQGSTPKFLKQELYLLL